MPYKLRFVQRIDQARKDEFLVIENQFIQLERDNPQMPQGTRYLPISGREPSNTLIWECRFDTLEELTAQLQALNADPGHEELLRRQIPFMQDSYTEIYEELS